MTNNQEDTFYQKAAHYCGYQERTEKEVQEKLRAWGVEPKEAEHMIQALKADHFLDEERYVEAFIRGKYLGKQWGKRKILAALTNKGLGQTLIQKGLAAIATTDYLQTLGDIAERKEKYLAGATPIQKRQKLTNYLLQKGYEPDLVCQTVQALVAQQHS